MKKCICCCLSHQNPATDLFRAVLICADFSPDSDQTSYYELWIHIWVKNILMLYLFQLLSSPDVNWWTGVLWIIMMSLIRLSFWRHPFTWIKSQYDLKHSSLSLAALYSYWMRTSDLCGSVCVSQESSPSVTALNSDNLSLYLDV